MSKSQVRAQCSIGMASPEVFGMDNSTACDLTAKFRGDRPLKEKSDAPSFQEIVGWASHHSDSVVEDEKCLLVRGLEKMSTFCGLQINRTVQLIFS